MSDQRESVFFRDDYLVKRNKEKEEKNALKKNEEPSERNTRTHNLMI